jgi:hypothetical protein
MLHIVTPCSRPENLDIISQSIPAECKWIIIHENDIKLPERNNTLLLKCDRTGPWGHAGRNFFLDNYNLNDEDWIYFLDDDNIIHPHFANAFQQLLTTDYSIIHWGQLNQNNEIRLIPDIGIDKIDTACYMVKWKHNKHIRYNDEKYNADGFYAIDCSQNGQILTLNNYLCYYNYLRTE